jgi:hypothetical protein
MFRDTSCLLWKDNNFQILYSIYHKLNGGAHDLKSKKISISSSGTFDFGWCPHFLQVDAF